MGKEKSNHIVQILSEGILADSYVRHEAKGNNRPLLILPVIDQDIRRTFRIHPQPEPA